MVRCSIAFDGSTKRSEKQSPRYNSWFFALFFVPLCSGVEGVAVQSHHSMFTIALLYPVTARRLPSQRDGDAYG
jgi:hypothetical protein